MHNSIEAPAFIEKTIGLFVASDANGIELKINCCKIAQCMLMQTGCIVYKYKCMSVYVNCELLSGVNKNEKERNVPQANQLSERK